MAELRRRAKGKLVVLGCGLDRLLGIFSSVDAAALAISQAEGRDLHHAFWIEFRALNSYGYASVFSRVVVRAAANRLSYSG